MVFQVGAQPEQKLGGDKREGQVIWHCWGLRKGRASDWEGLVDFPRASGLGEL